MGNGFEKLVECETGSGHIDDNVKPFKANEWILEFKKLLSKILHLFLVGNCFFSAFNATLPIITLPIIIDARQNYKRRVLKLGFNNAFEASRQIRTIHQFTSIEIAENVAINVVRKQMSHPKMFSIVIQSKTMFGAEANETKLTYETTCG